MILLPIAIALLATTPIPSDTPPSAPSHAQMMRLRSTKDLIGVTKLANGQKAPANLVVPELLNQSFVTDYIRQNYPQRMRADTSTYDMGWVWMFVSDEGAVADSKLAHSTGSSALDSFMLRIIAEARFAPGRVGSKKVGVWLPYPVQLPKYGSWSRIDGLKESGPVFTPYTVKPELLNRDEVARALVQNYPPQLRARGIGGTTLVWILVDETGRTQRAQVKATSGYVEIDAAAIEVASVFRFSPARKRDLPVPVWIGIPIVFRTK